ncbi:MAG: hypothetical protein V1835_04905 [Candidatus Micrarchaeota archaeon]
MKGNMLLGIVFGLMLLASLANALDSESVKKYVQYYSNQDEGVVVPSEMNPITYKENIYWHVYFTPQDSATTKNLIVIVREVAGSPFLETDPEILRAMYSIDYDMESLQLLKDNGIAFEDLKNVIDSLKYQLENSETPILENIKKQSEEDYTKIEDSLSDLKITADDSLAFIQDGAGFLENFKATATSQEIEIGDLNDAFKKYDDSVVSIYDFSAEVYKYQQAVSEKQLELSGMPIASELSKLANLKVRDSVIQSYNASLNQKKRVFDAKRNRKSTAVNDTIQSFFSRKAYTEASNAYGSKDNSGILSLLSSTNELSLKDCKLSNAELKKKWMAVQTAMDPQQSHSTKEYELVPAKIAEARKIAENLNSRLTGCLNATPTASVKPADNGLGKYAMPAIIIVVLILAAYYLNSYLKKKPEEENQE